jgi:hypothetical protein
VPPDWPGFTIRYLHRKQGQPDTPYEITVGPQIAAGVAQLTVDGQPLSPGRSTLDLLTDGAPHHVHLAWRASASDEPAAAAATHSA